MSPLRGSRLVVGGALIGWTVGGCGPSGRVTGRPPPVAGDSIAGAILVEAMHADTFADTTWVRRGRDSVGMVLRAVVIKDPDSSKPAGEGAPREPDRIPPDTLPVLSITDTVPFADLVRQELEALRAAPTANEWLEDRSGSTITRFEPGMLWRDRAELDLPESRWCVRARARIPLPVESTALLTALFYPPPMPPSADLPPVRDTLGLDVSDCRLGAVWLATVEAEPARARELAHGVRDQLATWLGPPVLDPPIRLWKADHWNDRAAWISGDADYLLGVEEWATEPPMIRVGSWLPASGIDLSIPGDDEIAREAGIPQLREVVSIARLDRTSAEALLAFVRQGYMRYEGLAALAGADSLFLDQLTRWIRYARTLPPRRRAAALLVADRALAWAGIAIDDEVPGGSENRAALEELGATFDRGYDHHYDRNWLWEARALDGDGPIGRRAFLWLLQAGMDTSTLCEGGDEGFRRVIAEGERFLQEPHDPDMAAAVHLEVARAYGDIVALASGTIPSMEDYLPPEGYRDEAPRARRKALHHYKVALDQLTAPEERQEIWREAWRLAAGLPPWHTRHVCIWD